MTLSIILTINNRSPEVSKRVSDSLRLPGNQPDELIVVLDRATKDAHEGAMVYSDVLDGFSVRYVGIDGDPGWRGPATAWNHGFAAATSDLYYCISSEVVQDEGNVDKARELCDQGQTVAFGACHNSEPVNLVVGAEPGLLVSSLMPRPLGFICCMPADKVMEIKGFDEEFMKGFWYDDDDFFLRMWRSGVDFLFDDSIHGTHIHHERPDLQTQVGKKGIQTNADYMLSKHGTLTPWNNLLRVEHRTPGKLWWSHP